MHDLVHNLVQLKILGDVMRADIYYKIAVNEHDQEDLAWLAELDLHERRVDDLPFPPRGRDRYRFESHARAIRVLWTKHCGKPKLDTR